jgi:hypothetical protein
MKFKAAAEALRFAPQKYYHCCLHVCATRISAWTKLPCYPEPKDQSDYVQNRNMVVLYALMEAFGRRGNGKVQFLLILVSLQEEEGGWPPETPVL